MISAPLLRPHKKMATMPADPRATAAAVKWKKPTKDEAALARRFLPRVFTTAGEPFALKDLVVVIHPDKTQRLIGYHLVWEDDIDFLSENDGI